MPKATWGNVEGSPWEDELDDYPVYEGDTPPKGLYRCAIKMLRLKENRNGDPMINGLLVINEPAGSKKAQYNGFDFWFNLNVTSSGSRWVNNFLVALAKDDAKAAALRKAFWAQKVMIDKSEPPNIVSIGALKITENMLVTVQCKTKKEFNGDDLTLDATRFVRSTDLTFNSSGANLDSSDDDAEDWEDEDGDEGEDDATEEPEESEEEYDEDPEVAEREEELAQMSRKELLAAAKENGLTVKRGTSEDDIIEMILDAEFPVDDADEEPEEPEEPEEDEDEEIAEEEPEPEPEPEPAKPSRRRASASKAKRPEPDPEPESEKPTRTRTGTRRRRAGGKPPF